MRVSAQVRSFSCSGRNGSYRSCGIGLGTTRGGGIPAMMPSLAADSNRGLGPASKEGQAGDERHRRWAATAHRTARRYAVDAAQVLQLLLPRAKDEALFAQVADQRLVSKRRRHCPRAPESLRRVSAAWRRSTVFRRPEFIDTRAGGW